MLLMRIPKQAMIISCKFDCDRLHLMARQVLVVVVVVVMMLMLVTANVRRVCLVQKW